MKLDPLLKIGIIVFIVGTGPLLLIIGAAKIGIGDPNPNPVLFGMMALISFWPAALITLLGLFKTLMRKGEKE